MPVDLSAVRHVVLDMDGTLYRGSRLFECTLPFLETLDALGVGRTFLTNNTSRSKADYVTKLRGFGIDACEDNIYTSADSTLDYLREALPALRRIAVLGTPSLCRQFEAEGFGIDWHAPEAVVVGFDTTLDYQRLCRTAYWISKGLPFLATHPDLVCPTEDDTVLVDCGSICACLTAATGRSPRVFGKPDPLILHGICRRHGVEPGQVAMVGDRLYTDIEMAQRAGAIGVLVLTGEATAEDAAQMAHPPDLVVADVGAFGGMLKNARQGVSGA